MSSKNVNNKKYAPILVPFNEKNWEGFGWLMTQKIDFENQTLTLFDTILKL